MNLKALAKKIKQGLIFSVLSLVIASGLVFSWSPQALASEKAKDIVQNRARQELDRVSGTGTSNQLEGGAKANVGRIRQEMDRGTGKAKGTAQRFKGEAQTNVGRSQRAIEDSAEASKDATEGFVESVKDFFKK